MRERHFRKLQKERHLSEIQFNILSNHTFKNLSSRERRQMAKLIYKAELIEMELKSKDINKTLQSFQEMIGNITINLIEKDDLDDDEDGFNNPFDKH
jgi:myo-inositol-1-phosphate synthase